MTLRVSTENGRQLGDRVDHQIDFRLVGKPGDRLVVSHTPSEQLGDGLLYLFRGHKFIADDSRAGRGTRICSVTVGAEHQFPHFMQTPQFSFTSAFNRPLGSGTSFSTCHPRLPFSIEVEFVETCEWWATVYGKAIVVPNEGVYAIVPERACDLTTDSIKQQILTRYGDSYLNAERARYAGSINCERCWFRLSRHANWPPPESLP